VVSDVNVTFGAGARVGSRDSVEPEITVVGWNNAIPAGAVIGSDCTIYPNLKSAKLGREIKNGEIIR
jgi:acetyltransferase-like isoleucine patch superfamily enzyme